MKWTKVFLHKDGFPIKAYVNKDNTKAYVFPLFGRYYGIDSDKSAIGLCFTAIFHVSSQNNLNSTREMLTFDQYLSSQENTAVIRPKVV